MSGERRSDGKVWWVMVVVIILLVVQYAANMILLDATRNDIQKDKDTRLRIDNELRTLAWCCASDTQIPKWTTPEPTVVRPFDLASAYGDREKGTVYSGILIAVPVRIGSISKESVGWHIGSKNKPAVIEFRFSDQIVGKVGEQVWIVGVCRGRIEDGLERESPKLNYKVIVEDCRIVPSENK